MDAQWPTIVALIIALIGAENSKTASFDWVIVTLTCILSVMMSIVVVIFIFIMEGQGNCPAGGTVERAMDDVNAKFNQTALDTGLSMVATIVSIELPMCLAECCSSKPEEKVASGTVVGLTPSQ